MNKKVALLMACFAISSLLSCNESGDWRKPCEEGARRCVGNSIIVCNDGETEIERTCTANEYCDEVKLECVPNGTPGCTENSRKCDGNKVLICVGGNWTTQTTCTTTCNPDKLDCDDTPQKDCEDNAVRCASESGLEKCVDGKWVPEACEGDKKCYTTKDGDKCVDCKPGDTRCIVDENGASMLSKCEDGEWAAAEACAESDAEKLVCDANPGKSCVNVLSLLTCPADGDVACQTVYGQEYAVICENGEVTDASGICPDGEVCDVPSGGCTSPDECGNGTVGAGEQCEDGVEITATCADATGKADATGTVVCKDCQYDVSGCLYCGDGIVNNQEQCDGSIPEGTTCASAIGDGKNYTGTVVCTNDCKLDISGCTAGEREILACNFQWIATADGAYGTVALNGKSKDDYMGRLVCIDEKDSTHVVSLDATYNVDKDTNVEFAVMDLSSVGGGKYKCTFEFKLTSSEDWYACQGVDYAETWADPILVADNELEVLPESGWYREYAVQVCTPNERVCDGNTGFKDCNADGFGYGEVSTCLTDDNGQPTCTGAGVCGIECNDNYTMAGGVCTLMICEPDEKKCEDNKLMVCDSTRTAFELAKDCTAGIENGTGTCDDATKACKVNCSEGYTEIDGECVEIVCEENEKKCIENDLMVCNATRTDFELDETCSTDKPNAQSICVVNACVVSCFPTHTDIGGVCTLMVCEPNEKKCDGENIMVCNSTRTGFVVDTTCTTEKENAEAICDANACQVRCKEGYTDVEGTCLKVICEPAQKSCDETGKNVLTCNESGTGYDTTFCSTALENGEAYCSDTFECAERCKDTFALVDDVCVKQICAKDETKCNDTKDGLLVCNDTLTAWVAGDACPVPENATATCDDEAENKCGFVCAGGYTKNGEKCDREILACNFQWISADDGAYGRLDPNGKTKDNFDARLVCLDKDHEGTVVTLDATFFKEVDPSNPDDKNLEFAVEDVSSIEVGNYSCTFEFKLHESETWFACQGVDYDQHWNDPIAVNDNEKEVLPATDWYRDYTAKLCKAGDKICDGTSYRICNEEGMSYGELIPCPSENGTASCTDGVCDITCNDPWTKKDGACVCMGDYVLSGNYCIEKCKPAQNNCEPNAYNYCDEDDGLMKSKDKPDDGKLYICNEAEGWVPVDCIVDTDCAKPAHATEMTCAENQCTVKTCETNWTASGSNCICTGDDVVLKDGDCVAITDIHCTDGSQNYAVGEKICDTDGVTPKICKSTGVFEPLESCAFACNAGNCRDARDCGSVKHNDWGCSDIDTLSICYDGNWKTDEASVKDCNVANADNQCNAGVTPNKCEYICNVGYDDDTANQKCVSNILACQYYMSNDDGAFGWIAENGKSSDAFDGQVVCISKTDPSKTYTFAASFNEEKITGEGYKNYEFMVQNSEFKKMDIGQYDCTYAFKLKSSDVWFACDHDWTEPLAIRDGYAGLAENWYFGVDSKCEEGTRICDGDSNYKVCAEDGLSYSESKACDSDEHALTYVCTGAGVCESKTCDAGYHIKDGKCIANTCEKDDRICDSNRVMVCNETLDGFSVETPCTTDKPNAKSECVKDTEGARCVVSCVDDGFIEIDGVCTAVVCKPNETKRCNTDKSNVQICNETGTDFVDVLPACAVPTTITGAEYAKPVCTSEFTCDYECIAPYAKDTHGNCVEQKCTSADQKMCNDEHNGLLVCNTDDYVYEPGDPCTTDVANAHAICDDEKLCTFACNNGYVENGAGNACESNIVACKFHDVNGLGAFGRVSKGDKAATDFDAQLVCVPKGTGDIYTFHAALNENNGNNGIASEGGYENYEFVVWQTEQLSTMEIGSYDCVYAFKLKTSDVWFACDNAWSSPLEIKEDTYTGLEEKWYTGIDSKCEKGTRICAGNTGYRVCAEDGLSYGDVQACPSEHGTASCSNGVCSIDCTSPWVAEGGNCVCTGNYWISEGNCIEKCKPENNHCDDNAYYKCANGEDGSWADQKITKPGDLFVCTNTDGWKPVDCVEGHTEACAEKLGNPANAKTYTCTESNTCQIATCNDNWTPNSTGSACECTGNFVTDSNGNCIPKCESGWYECSDTAYEYCGTDGLKRSENKPTGEGYYTCDATGWHGPFNCTSDENCPLAAHATAMTCTAEHACVVKTCEDKSWTPDGASCVCADGYVSDGNGGCILKCTSEQNNCSGEYYEYCDDDNHSSTWLMKKTEKPGELYVCTKADGWTPVECINAAHCSEKAPAHGTMACTTNKCELESCNDGFTKGSGDAEGTCVCNNVVWNNTCVEITAVTCEQDGIEYHGNDTICDATGTKTLVCNVDIETGKSVWADGTECGFVCDPDLRDCRDPKTCGDNKTAHNAWGCSDSDTLSICNDGEWKTDEESVKECAVVNATYSCDANANPNACTFDCNDGYVKNGDETACVSNILACQFHYLDNSGAFGQVSKNGKDKDDFEAKVVCVSSSDEVTSFDATNLGQAQYAEENYEFEVTHDTLDTLAVGSYNCTYAIKLKNSDVWFACPNASSGWEPVKINSDDDYKSLDASLYTTINSTCVEDSRICDGENSYKVCLTGGLNYSDTKACDDDEHALTYKCVDAGVCESQTCETGYHVKDGKCVANTCEAGEQKCQDNAIMICNATLDGFDIEKTCATDKANAISTCTAPVNEGDSYACVVSCKDGFKDIDGVCTPVVCEANVTKRCSADGSNIEICNEDGTAFVAQDPACAAPTDINGAEYAYAVCKDSKCDYECKATHYKDATGDCIEKSCTIDSPSICNTEKTGTMVCDTEDFVYIPGEDCTTDVENAHPICDAEKLCTFECNDGYWLTSDGKGCERTVGYCNTQWIDNSGIYGYIYPNGHNADMDYYRRALCYHESDPNTFVVISETNEPNKTFYDDVQFSINDLSTLDKMGKWYCTFEFAAAGSNYWYACKATDRESGAGLEASVADTEADHSTVTSEFYREYEVTFCTDKENGDYCNGDTIVTCEDHSVKFNGNYCASNSIKKCVEGEVVAEPCIANCEDGASTCYESCAPDSYGDWCHTVGETQYLVYCDGTEIKTTECANCGGDGADKVCNNCANDCKDGHKIGVCEGNQVKSCNYDTITCESGWGNVELGCTCDLSANIVDGGECVAFCNTTNDHCDTEYSYICDNDTHKDIKTAKPADGLYVCDTTVAGGWKSVECIGENVDACSGIAHAKTYSCSLDNQCQLAACEETWKVEGNSCVCDDGYVDNGEGGCAKKCDSADNHCDTEQNVYIQCNTSSWLNESIAKPESGLRYCDDATGWSDPVECIVNDDCTDIPAHATMACTNYVCGIASCQDGFEKGTGDKANECVCTGDNVIWNNQCVAASSLKCDSLISGDETKYTKGEFLCDPNNAKSKKQCQEIHKDGVDSMGWVDVAECDFACDTTIRDCRDAKTCGDDKIAHGSMGCSDSSTLSKCNDGSWSTAEGEFEVAAAGLKCENNAIVCEAPIHCVDADNYQTCEGSTLSSSISVIAGVTSCDTETNSLKCIADIQCDGTTKFKTCTNGTLSDVATDVEEGLTCNITNNALECAAETFCVNEKSYKTCTEGVLSTATSITDENLKCDGNTVKCISQIICDTDTEYRTCEDGLNNNYTNHTIAADSFKECKDNAIVCKTGYTASGDNCVCDANKTYCTTNSETGEIEYSTCDGTGDFVVNKSKTLSCKNETEVGECLNGKTKCDSAGKYTCSNGLWGEAEPCSSLGCAGDVCRICEDEQYRCTGTTHYQMCMNNEWYPSEPETVEPGFICEDDEIKCASPVYCVTETSYKTCKDAKLSTETITFSDSDKNYLSCINGEVVCKEAGKFCAVEDGIDYVVTCTNNTNTKIASWDYEDMCEDTEYCDVTDPQCKPKAGCKDAVSEQIVAHNEQGCASKTIWSICDNGNWSTLDKDVVDCTQESGIPANGTGICDPVNKCTFACNPKYTKSGNSCVCDTNETYCTTSGTGEIEYSTCDGAGDFVVTTSAILSCKNEKEVGECKNDDTKCVEDEGVYTCSGGLWGTAEPCTYGCNASGKACKLQEEITCEGNVAIGVKTCVDNTQLKTCTLSGSTADFSYTTCPCENNACQECLNDTEECIENNNYRVCVNNKWESRSLAEGLTCVQNGNKISSECAADVFCADDTTLMTCSSSTLTPTIIPESDRAYLKCDNNLKAIVCKTEGFFCEPNDVQVTCDNGIVTRDTCGEKQICKSFLGCEYVCTDAYDNKISVGGLGCSTEHELKECQTGGNWSTEAIYNCVEECNADDIEEPTCTGKNKTYCDGKYLKHIDANGEAGIEKDCGRAELCNADEDRCYECLQDSDCDSVDNHPGKCDTDKICVYYEDQCVDGYHLNTQNNCIQCNEGEDWNESADKCMLTCSIEKGFHSYCDTSSTNILKTCVDGFIVDEQCTVNCKSSGSPSVDSACNNTVYCHMHSVGSDIGTGALSKNDLAPYMSGTRVACGNDETPIKYWTTITADYSGTDGSNDYYNADLQQLYNGEYKCVFEVSLGSEWYVCDNPNSWTGSKLTDDMMVSDVNGAISYSRTGGAEPECTTHDDCTDENAPACIQGKCDACTSNDDCGVGYYCDEDSMACEPKCTSHDDCTDENAPACIQGKCDVCASNDDCGVGYVCNEDTMACDHECSIGQTKCGEGGDADKLYTCTDELTWSETPTDCTTDGKICKTTGANTAACAGWETIVESSETCSEFKQTLTLVKGNVNLATNQCSSDGYFNTCHWNHVISFDDTYYKYVFSDSDLEKMSDKTQLSVSAAFAAQSSTNLTHAKIALYNNNGIIGNACEVGLNNRTIVSIDKDDCQFSIDNTDGLNLRIIGYVNKDATSNACLRIYPFNVYAR